MNGNIGKRVGKVLMIKGTGGEGCKVLSIINSFINLLFIDNKKKTI